MGERESNQVRRSIFGPERVACDDLPRNSLSMAGYFFASPVDVDIKLDGEDSRKQVDIKGEKDRIISCPVYYDGDSIAGQVRCLLFMSKLPLAQYCERFLYVCVTERRSHMMVSKSNL
jgi:hypothetical protein